MEKVTITLLFGATLNNTMSQQVGCGKEPGDGEPPSITKMTDKTGI